MYYTFVPVLNELDAEEVNKLSNWEIHSMTPRINHDWPKNKPKKTYWVGK